MWSILAWCLLAAEPLWYGAPKTEAAKIVTLGPSLTELLFDLDRGASIIGVSRFDDYPTVVKSLKCVGGLTDPDFETIAALKPDLVLAIYPHPGFESLARLSISTLVLPVARLDDLPLALNTLGELTRTEELAKKLILALPKLPLTTRHNSHKVLVVVGANPLVAVGKGSYLDDLLFAVGLDNVIKKGGVFPVLSEEALLSLDAEVLVDLSDSAMATELLSRLAKLKTKSPKVVTFHDNRLQRLSLRTFAAMQELVAAISRAVPPRPQNLPLAPR